LNVKLGDASRNQKVKVREIAKSIGIKKKKRVGYLFA
jgi:hypothetical protein